MFYIVMYGSVWYIFLCLFFVAPSYFELQADDNQPEVVEVPAVISVPATNDDQEVNLHKL